MDWNKIHALGQNLQMKAVKAVNNDPFGLYVAEKIDLISLNDKYTYWRPVTTA